MRKPRGIIGQAFGVRGAHGNGAAALVRSETVDPTEWPTGPQEPEQAEAGDERREDGTFTAQSRTAQRKGGRARKESTAISSSFGVDPADPAYRAQVALAKRWAKAERASIAATVGRGVCGVGPSTLVIHAGMMIAAGRYLMGSGDAKDIAAGAGLLDKARTQILTAGQIAAVEAETRPKASSQERLEAMLEANMLAAERAAAAAAKEPT